MEATITKTNPLGTERVGKLMMRYAVPSIISIVVNSLYNMVDQVFIGQGVGYLGNAATNVIMPSRKSRWLANKQSRKKYPLDFKQSGGCFFYLLGISNLESALFR